MTDLDPPYKTVRSVNDLDSPDLMPEIIVEHRLTTFEADRLFYLWQWDDKIDVFAFQFYLNQFGILDPCNIEDYLFVKENHYSQHHGFGIQDEKVLYFGLFSTRLKPFDEWNYKYNEFLMPSKKHWKHRIT